MTAQERISATRDMNAAELCQLTSQALTALASTMNEETMLLRAGQFKQAAELSAQKAQLAQDYVGLARAIQHEAPRLRTEEPELMADLQAGHERLATQMADNLKVLATAKTVTEDLLGDVARSVNGTSQTRTYGASGQMSNASSRSTQGIALNRAL